MATFNPEINIVTAVPTIVKGPDGTLCVDPQVFTELVAFDHAIQLGVLCFVAGIIIGAAIMYARSRWG